MKGKNIVDDNMMSYQTLYEGELFSVYRFEEEGEVNIDVHVFDMFTIHFAKEDWNEFLEVMHSLSLEPEDDDEG